MKKVKLKKVPRPELVKRNESDTEGCKKELATRGDLRRKG